jgi:tRNA/tmRNA/rRNA uracil-C5-methylase (TrmA/RlmC/RlmD family)
VRSKVASPSAGDSFADFLKPLIPPSGREQSKAIEHSAPLAHLEYGAELIAKNKGLELFWHRHHLPGHPEPLTPSPRPRNYRTTSKRKAILRGSILTLLFGDKTVIPQKPAFLPSPLEPQEHARIYTFLQQKLSEPTYRLVAGHLNYIVIRGSYSERAVIFNVDTLSGPLVRKLKMVAEHLQKEPELAAAAYIYLDPSRSEYYLESRRPVDTVHFKKLFGPGQLSVTFGGCRYRYHPTSFSQVNESMVPVMLELARSLLSPQPKERFLDLYCGYGLFSCFLAADYRQVWGIDAEGASIQSASANIRLNPGKGNIRFFGRRITPEVLEAELPSSAAPEAVLLDPPRQGPQAGVISTICRREPQKVLHVFCGVDQIPAALKEWRKGGYLVQRVVPLDMFPGSMNLEVLVLLVPHGKRAPEE